jgi:UDP-glucose 4-epimerase
MAVLVTGGAGFIGSHMVARLLDARRDVVVVDDLSSGHREVVPPDVPFVAANVADRAAMTTVLQQHHVDAIVHFAARIQVGESVTAPRLYWTGNVAATAYLLECALDAGVRSFILSSTAAVYGTPERVPIVESDPTRPINPYGETKLTIERMLASYRHAYGLRYAALRYFNAAGADASRGLGERHDPETHLIPLVLDAALGRRQAITVFGRDYDTPDGTCIRDYIHVIDLVDAHLAALEYLERGGESGAFNLGTGTGYSVDQVIHVCESVTGREIPVVYGPRREGDPAILVASPQLAQERFGWKATRSLERIAADAWEARRPSSTARANEPGGVTRSARPQDEENANVR